MFNSQAQQNQLDPNDPNFRTAPAHIPAGKFIDIDEQFYLPKNDDVEALKNLNLIHRAKPLEPYPNRIVNEGLVDLHPIVNDDFNQKVNYGSYLYNQITGYQ